MSMYKVKAAIAGGVLAAVMAAAAIGGTVIQAMSDNSYKSWKQYGESWSGMTLGSSRETVAASGCAVTSAAMLMVKSGSVTDDSFTPATIVSYMSANGGFTASGGINWNKLTGYAPSFIYCGKASLSGTQQQKAQQMQNLMNQGYYLAAVVKNGGHFVAIDSVNGSSVIMMDPGSKSTSLFDRYTSSGVVSLRLFKGANSTVSTAEPTETTPVEMTEPTETTVIETTETTALYTTTAEPTETAEETTAVTTDSTETQTTTTETTKETTATETTTAAQTTAVQTTSAETTASSAETTTVVTTVTTPVPSVSTPVETTPTIPGILPDPPMPEQAVIVPDLEPVPIIPSRAEAGLFRLQGKALFMTVRFTTTDNLHLREEANTDSDILLVIPEGTALDVVEIDSGFTWGRVAYNGKEGWISLNYAGL